MEIERKFLTKELPFDVTQYPFHAIQQAYISFSPTIRLRKQDDSYILTVKGKGKIAKEEFELFITESQFKRLFLKTEGTPVVKKRYLIPLENGLTAELDIYEGELAGLMTTEVEFPTLEEALAYEPPLWFGEDVSLKREYKNTSLSRFGLPRE